MTRDNGKNLRRILCATAVAPLASMLHAPAQAQSFDCAKASTPIEHTICEDPKVAALDVSLASELKSVIAAAPAQRKELIVQERHWIADRNQKCLTGQPGKGGSMAQCLSAAYQERIQALKTVSVASASGLAMASCQKLADRYRRLPNVHLGDSKLGNVLASSSDTGVMLSQPLSTLHDPARDLAKWGSSQNPPIVIPAELVRDYKTDSGSAELGRLPNTQFYSISSLEGTAHCYNTLYFVVVNGRAQKADEPPGFEEDENGACMVDHYFGRIDDTPAIFEESYNAGPEMSSSVMIATWNDGHFEGPCTVTFSFAPAVSQTTWNDWGGHCDGSECDGLKSAAMKLAEMAQQDSGGAPAKLEATLSPAQRATYENALRAAANSAKPDDASGDPIHLPYVYHDRVYVVSLAHYTIGWREFQDWRVEFSSLAGDKLLSQGVFPVGVSKGKLTDVSVKAGK